MEELDRLKKDWKKNEESYPQFSEKEIYAMLHKKSSSIVKWILIISVLEFVFWGIGSLLYSTLGSKQFEAPFFIVILDYFNYAILISFMVLFYYNYRRIAAEKPVKELMYNIISVRRVVRFYVLYNLFVISFSMLCGLFMFGSDHPDEKNAILILTIGVVIIGLIVLLLFFVYNLLYGRLIKKLNKNYVELEKIKQ